MLNVSGLCASYGAIRAVTDLSFEVGAGTMVALLGANGAGKSTTLRSIAGLHRPVITAKRVKGPIVATSSFNDRAVRLAYPVASKLGRHLGEHKVLEEDLGGAQAPDYHGIGDKGFVGIACERKQSMEPGTAYGFEPGKVYTVDATKHVPEHSDVRSEPVAWLIWNAVLRSKPD